MNRCDGVSSVISHPAPTAWIVAPMVDARLAIQIARNAGKRKGASADGAGGCSDLTPQRVAAPAAGGNSARSAAYRGPDPAPDPPPAAHSPGSPALQGVDPH